MPGFSCTSCVKWILSYQNQRIEPHLPSLSPVAKSTGTVPPIPWVCSHIYAPAQGVQCLAFAVSDTHECCLEIPSFISREFVSYTPLLGAFHSVYDVEIFSSYLTLLSHSFELLWSVNLWFGTGWRETLRRCGSFIMLTASLGKIDVLIVRFCTASFERSHFWLTVWLWRVLCTTREETCISVWILSTLITRQI